MKKFLSILLILTLILCIFVSCGKKDEPDPMVVLQNNALGILTNYNVGNGYTYEYKQVYGEEVIHSKTIVLSKSGETYAWTIQTKDLNNSFSETQYTEETTSYSFSSGTYTSGTSTVSNKTFEEVNPVQFSNLVEKIDHTTLSITNEEGGYKVTATLSDVNGVSGISLEAHISSDFQNLISLKMSYSQDLTTSTYEFKR